MTVPSADQESTGVVDTVGLAFGMLNQRPYLIWILILLDLMTWSGVRLMSTRLDSVMPDQLLTLDVFSPERTGEIELLNLLSWPLPTLLSTSPFESARAPVELGASSFDGAAGLLLAGFVLVLAFIVLMSYLMIVGRLVSGADASGWRFPGDCVRSSWRALGITFAVAALFLFMLTPFAAVGAGLLAIGVDPTAFLFLAALIISVWLGVFFVFSVPALVLGERDIYRALRASYQMVKQNFPSVAGLLVIIMLVRAATPHALSIFADSPWSVPFAIVANAYVATGLIAAGMLFFRNRAAAQSASTI